jgi:hypothetical protein
MQVCNLCLENLLLEFYYYRKDTKKYEKICKKCRNKNQYKKEKEGLIKKRNVFDFICINCNLKKSNNDFYIKDKLTGRLDTTCKDCRKEGSKNWHINNREKSLKNKKEWNLINRDTILYKMREYYQKRNS